jgi:soluble lytic murein transglycosylase
MRRKAAVGYKRCMRLRIMAFLATLLLPALPARAQDVIGAIRANRWSDAQQAAAAYPDPVAAKLVTFYRLLAPNAASFAEIDAFMSRSPDWPMQSLLARRRDEALANDPDDGAVAGFCLKTRPVLSHALQRCAEALANTNHADQAAEFARAAWVTGPTDPQAETEFMQRWGSVLSPADQWRRFDYLAWSDTASATRQVERLDPADKPKAQARLALRRDDPNALTLVEALPAADQNAPAMMLERARWLRRANRDDEALALWTSVGQQAERAAPSSHLAAFWSERNLLARRRLQTEDAAGAYALADGHAQRAPEQVADAEFLAGFIALRMLNDPAAAARHFHKLAAVSKAAITQGRAHYWLARAAAARGDTAAAKAEYSAAAVWITTYYGQLAAIALGDDPARLNARLLSVREPRWDRQQALNFAGRETTRAAALLVAWGDPHRARAFLLRLEELTPDNADKALDARLADGLGMPDQSVAIARRAGLDALMLPDTGWPMPVTVADGTVPPAVGLGIMRQESSFDISAVSPSGARGLMQLMPGTAQTVAHQLGLAPSLGALTTDAAYNVELGTSYLHGLIDEFGGALPLAIAAYNAGPNRVQEWLADLDPRAGFGKLDMIDWIELIPFSETRNYVQRVIENIVIYQAKMHDPAPHPLARWLH